MLWVDPSGTFIIVPFIIGALFVLFLTAFLELSSLADIHCPVCRMRFGDIFDLRRHIKTIESRR